jgi:thiamine-phosphate pyrophosphorylase
LNQPLPWIILRQMKTLDQCRLYAFVDTAYLANRDLETVARQLCDGGADLVQLRAKTALPAEIQRLGEKLLPITEAAGVRLVINDHPELALAVGAPFCHLGQEDFFQAGYTHVSQVPAQFGGQALGKAPLRIGLSSHAPAQAKRAQDAGADYVAIGPVFATPTKPEATPVTLEYVRWAAANVRIPWFAIGGINLENLDMVLAAGARRVCVVSAILNAPDVQQACQAFKERLLSAGPDETQKIAAA